MKKILLKIAIWLLDHLEEKVSFDFNEDQINDLTSAKISLQEKLDQLNRK